MTGLPNPRPLARTIACLAARPRLGSQPIARVDGELVGADVIGVAVAAVGVVGDHGMGPKVAQHGGELVERLVAGADERPLVVVAGVADHAGIAPSPRAAEMHRRVSGAVAPQGGQRGVEFVDAEAAQLVGFAADEPLVRLADDFAEFAERARHHRHLRPAADELSDGTAGGDRLVVWVRVHERHAQPGQIGGVVGGVGHVCS